MRYLHAENPCCGRFPYRQNLSYLPQAQSVKSRGPVEGWLDDRASAPVLTDDLPDAALAKQPTSLAAHLAAVLFAVGYFGQGTGMATPKKRGAASPFSVRNLVKGRRGI
jgi:hypothetical protein